MNAKVERLGTLPASWGTWRGFTRHIAPLPDAFGLVTTDLPSSRSRTLPDMEDDFVRLSNDKPAMEKLIVYVPQMPHQLRIDCNAASRAG